MKTIVTGGAGFIGYNLCKHLLKKNHEVWCIDNLVTGDKKNLEQLSKHKNFVFLEHDIVKPFSERQKKLFLKTGTIYHLACPTGVDNLERLSEEMLLTSSVGTKNILDLALLLGSKVLFTSSSEIYGNPEKFPQHENYTGNVDPLGTRSPYEEGKRFAESLVGMYVKKYGLKAYIVRVFNTYGPGISQKDDRVIPQFLFSLKKGEPLAVKGKGEQTRTFCYVDDLVEGLVLVSEKGRPGEVYNLGGEEEVQIKKLAEEVLTLNGLKSSIKFVPRPIHDHRGRKPSLKKIWSLGWRQKTPLREGLLKTLNSI